MKLDDLLDLELYKEMQAGGYVRLQVHHDEPYTIVNYTKQCAWEHKWNDVTTKCRGLIYNYETGDVVARPFEKFFNYGEIEDWTPPRGRVRVSDKMDGSLGIIYPRSDGTYAVATRGSFTSDQAIHATEVLNSQYGHIKFNKYPDFTFLFEIIYPDNRIVLNYGDMDDLVILGGMNIEYGTTLDPVEAALVLHWDGPVTDTFLVDTFEDALAMPVRLNKEGIVVLFESTGERVKLKQADYVALHRIVTGMTDRVIWEALGNGQTEAQIKEPLPEEFHPWVEQVVVDLFVAAEEICWDVAEEFFTVMDSMPEDFTRKDFALAVKDSPNRAYLFMYLDGKSIWDVVWKSIKPEAGRSMTNTTEDE